MSDAGLQRNRVTCRDGGIEAVPFDNFGAGESGADRSGERGPSGAARGQHNVPQLEDCAADSAFYSRVTAIGGR